DDVYVQGNSRTHLICLKLEGERVRAGFANDVRRKTNDAKQNGRDAPAVLRNPRPYFPRFTAFFNSAPGVNFATRRAAILMVAPVCGLRPLRAFRCETENVPKPIRATGSPFWSELVMLSTPASIAAAAWVLLIPAPAAIRSIKSALFIVAPGEGLLCSCGSAIPVRQALSHALDGRG